MNLQKAINLTSGILQRMLRTSLVTAAAALALIGIASAQHTLGLKLGMNGNGNQQAGSAGALLPTDLAGAPGYAQVNWNILGRYGNNDTNSTSSGTNIYALLDSNGDDTHITIQWDATGNWSVQGSGTPTDQGDPNINLMNAYDDSNNGGNVNLTPKLANGIFGQSGNNKPLVYFSGLQQWLATEGASQYDVVIYVDGDAQSGRTGEYWIQQASGSTANLVFDPSNPTASTPGIDLTTHIFIRDYSRFTLNPAYQEVPYISNIGRVALSGNFAVFKGMTADSFLLRTAEFNTRCGLNAIQIIPRTAPIAATLAPLLPSTTYPGGKASFRVTAAGLVPFTYQWLKDGVSLVDGGNISGSTSATLNITGVSAGDQASYSVIVTNPAGIVTSTVAPLTVISPPTPGSYAERIFADNPVAYWRLNDSGDPSTNFSVAADVAGGFNGIYGQSSKNGFNSIVGPQPPDFPGFEADNSAMQTFHSTATPLPYPSTYINWAVAPALNLNTNAVTISAWIYPTALQAANTGIVFNRGSGTDVGGLIFAPYTGSGSAVNQLGYVWQNNGNTFNWTRSGMVAPANEWSLVALVINPTYAVIYLYNAQGQFAATNVFNHTNMVFGAPTMIGTDPSSTGVPQNRAFAGSIDEVAVFNQSLPASEILNLYKKGIGLTTVPTAIPVPPRPLALFEGRDAKFSVVASGEPPLSYQWRKNGSNLSDGGNIAGSSTTTLTVSSVTIANDMGSYDVVVMNGVGGTLASSAATLSVVVSNALTSPYEAELRMLNPIAYWRMNEANGTQYAYDYWGGHIATNENVTLGVAGPQPPAFSGLESTNTAAQYQSLSFADTSMAPAAPLDPTTGLLNDRAQFSVIGWFNTAGTIGQRKGLFGQNDVVEFGFHGNGPDGQAQVGVFTGFGSAFLNQSTNVIPGTWYLIAAIGAGTNVNLYLASAISGGGGVQVVQATGTGTTTNYGRSIYPFRIGGGGILDDPLVNRNDFDGVIDEVAVFDRALSLNELSTLFGAGLSGGGLPPTITIQPVSQALYAGKTATFSVSALGSAPNYVWRTNGVPVQNGGKYSGVNTPTLTITNVASNDSATIDVLITNFVGSVTSSVVTLTVVTPSPGGFEAAVLAANPLAYYRLNETNDPSSGTAVDNDYWGGHAGLYAAGALNGFNGILGPQPPSFTFDTSNDALGVSAGTLSSWATAPFGSLSTNTVTMCMWIMPTNTPVDFAGLLMNRNSGVAGGFGFATGGQIGYTWNNNSGATWGFNSGMVPPLNAWSFVGVVITPTNAILYMFNTNAECAATNTLAHTSDVFGNNWRIGKDDSSATDDGSRTFSGSIDEVAVFNRSLTGAQLRQLYVSGKVGVPGTLTITQSGGNVILNWPQGMLLQADNVHGPWTPVTGYPLPPYTVPPGGTMQFFRVQVQ
jgi:hypothetical protein